MKRKVFIHNNENLKPDNDVIVVTTYDAFVPGEVSVHRSVDAYGSVAFMPCFMGMFSSHLPPCEVVTTWIPSTGDDLFSADARNLHPELYADAMELMVA